MFLSASAERSSTATRVNGKEKEQEMKKKQVPKPVATASAVTMEIKVEEYRTIAVFIIPGMPERDLYQAKQKLLAQGINCSVVDAGGGNGKALSVPISTMREQGDAFTDKMRSCLPHFTKILPSSA